MTGLGRLGGTVAALVVAVVSVGCSDDDPFGEDALAELDDQTTSADVASEPPGGESDDPTAGDAPDAGLVVTVEGTEYLVDTELGGYCEVGDSETGTELAAGGFDQVSGARVELALRYQIGETTPSGADEYYGGLTIASGEASWDTSSQEPWPFDLADPTGGTVTMVDSEGQSVEVMFALDCP